MSTFANKGPSSQGFGFSSGHVWIWELYYKESWAQRNWCFWSVVLEMTLESPLMKVKEESEQAGLKLNIQKNKIMAFGPITSWQIDGETVGTVADGAPKSPQMVTAALQLKDICSLEEKLWPN